MATITKRANEAWFTLALLAEFDRPLDTERFGEEVSKAGAGEPDAAGNRRPNAQFLNMRDNAREGLLARR